MNTHARGRLANKLHRYAFELYHDIDRLNAEENKSTAFSKGAGNALRQAREALIAAAQCLTME